LETLSTFNIITCSTGVALVASLRLAVEYPLLLGKEDPTVAAEASLLVDADEGRLEMDIIGRNGSTGGDMVVHADSFFAEGANL